MKERFSGPVCLLNETGGIPDWPPLISGGPASTLTNVNCDGFRWRTGWKIIQPVSAAAYDWSTVDAAIADCLAAGKKIGINVAAGGNCPAWLYTVSPRIYKFNCDNGGLGGDSFQPLPWDTNYLARLQTFLTAFGAKYDGEPTIAYIVLSGFMQLAEMNFVFIADDDVAANDLATTPPGGVYTGLAAYSDVPRISQKINIGISSGTTEVTWNDTSRVPQFAAAWDEGISILGSGIPVGAVFHFDDATHGHLSVAATFTGPVQATFVGRYGKASITAYKEGAQAIIDMFMVAFPNTPVMLTYSRPFPTPPGVTAGREIKAFAQSTYGDSFGLMTASLKGSCAPHLPPQTKHTAATGFQAIYASNHMPQEELYLPNSTCLPTVAPVPLDDLLGAAVEQAAHFIELYKPDIDGAGNQLVLEARRAQLQDNADSGGIAVGGGTKEVYYTTDTGIDMNWTVFVPGVGKHPANLVLHAGGYKAGSAGPQNVCVDLAETGLLLSMATEYRLAPPHTAMNSQGQGAGHLAPGQDDVGDPGYFPEQTTDVGWAIVKARADPRCNGLVYLEGGSAGGSHSLWWAANGKRVDPAYGGANTRPDLVVLCSCGVANLADLNMLHLDCGVGFDETCPHDACMNYNNRDDSGWPDYTEEDLAALRVASPITYIHADMPPIFVIISDKDSLGIPTSTGLSINSYNKDGSIGPLENGENGLIPALLAMGWTESTSAFPEANTFKKLVVPVNGHAHAFQYWATGNLAPVGANEAVKPWLLAGPPEGGGITPPPPVNHLLRYETSLVSIPPGARGSVPAVVNKDTPTCPFTNLDGNTLFKFGTAGVNEFGKGPESFNIFLSDPDIPSGPPKARRKGLYNLFSSPGGDPGDVTDLGQHPFWDFAYIDGSRYRTGWVNIQGTSETLYDWTALDAYLAFCVTKNKYAGIGLGAGINSPPWLYVAGARPFVEHGPDPGTMPIPWDQVYLQKWMTFVRAFGLRYDAHPKLAYVAIGGLGQVVETYVVADQTDQTNLDAIAVSDGYLSTVDGWTKAAKQIIAVYAGAFQTTPLLISAAKPVHSSDGNSAITSLIAWMKTTFGPTRIGIMNAGLNGATVPGSTPVNQAIFDARGAYLTGYQFGVPSGNHNCDPTQTVPPYDPTLGFGDALSAGVAMGIEFEELYEIDVNNPDQDYIDLMTSTQADLKGQ